MKEHTFDRSIETTPRAEPNFDDEWTLLSARQVVPLEKINANVRNRRKWFLGGAFAVAMMLGAASALVASYFKLPSASSPANEVSQVELTPAPLATEEPVASEDTVASEPEVETFAEPLPEVGPGKVSEKRKIVVKRDSVVIEPRITPGISEKDELERIRDAVLVDEWQERRARRVARRERRRAERYNRDLSNLDEIFEGPRRP